MKNEGTRNLTVAQWDFIGSILLVINFFMKISGTYRLCTSNDLQDASVAVAIWWFVSSCISTYKAYDFRLTKSTWLSCFNILQDFIVLIVLVTRDRKSVV